MWRSGVYGERRGVVGLRTTTFLPPAFAMYIIHESFIAAVTKTEVSNID